MSQPETSDSQHFEVVSSDDPGRRLQMAGTFNFRDVGGYPTADGGQTRFGRLFRADALCYLDDRSRASLHDIGLRTVLDLREDIERDSAPDALQGLELNEVHVPVFGNTIYSASTGDRPDATLQDLYALALEKFAPQIVEAVGVLAADGALPAVVHCSAGKDRTGMVVAIALSAVGVPDEWVIADYAASESFLSGGFVEALKSNFARAGIVQDVSNTATQSPPELIRYVLRTVREHYGSVLEFLNHHGVGEKSIDRLRSRLVLPAEEVAALDNRGTDG
ncbi:tyrosine-protein phosphatase [Saxibacter everestensis]|uniref:Tyrosine-protein phosphatase n=1 Tax=Saxibacter everestensis TaxID=2909229 RepID=A0ABY8QR10_9MICO|nr:tyrosine-protein phosphatase [Brevibacteriaceae bacterium ZFBP1038]